MILPSVLAIVGLLAALGAIAGFIFQDQIKTASTNIGLSIENQNKPKFTFNTAEFPDWATVGNVYINPDDITDNGGKSKDDISISSLNVTQCKADSNCNKLVEKCVPHKGGGEDCKKLEQDTNDTHCSVSAYYKKQIINVDTAKDNELKQWHTFTIEPTEVDVKTLTMSTPEGDKYYKLYQYDTNNQDATYKRGSAFGFISLDSGHVEVRGVCNKASQLDETLPVLSAIRLEA